MAAPAALPWRVVWITGASTGIGRAVAVALAAQGVKVAASARAADKLVALAAEHPGITPYPLDVTDAAAVAAAAQRITDELGPIDLALFGAGTYQPVKATDIAPALFASMMQVNYMGTVNGIAAVLPLMQARKAGQIALIASVAGYRGLPKAAAYGPTKAALINLAECLAPELALAGITVSVVNPGFVRTPLTAQNDFPMPWLMEPEDAAAATISGLTARKFEIAYPRPFVRLLKIARLLPYRLYFALIRRQVLTP